MSHLLEITDLHVSIEGKPIVNGVSLSIAEGETHAIMGPNGSGKSTLVNTLMGHPRYEVTNGSVNFRGKDLLTMSPDERAQAGLFLAFQYPREIAGVSLRSFLFAAYNAIQQNEKRPSFAKPTYRTGRATTGKKTKNETQNTDNLHASDSRQENEKVQRLSPIQFKKMLEEHMTALHMDPAFAERPVNQGFSGGEKKKAEILQLSILKPALALLDETDSGLDVDALKVVAEGIQSILAPEHCMLGAGEANRPFSALLVTHYARILRYLRPDRVHVMVAGRVAESGDADLANRLEEEGYEQFEKPSKKHRRIALE